jgi:4-amino-4-deoxy-L-arabinose transferase-like glycosyltransferase
MTRTNPAIVSQAGVRPLARWALLLLCVAYLLPGQLGRDAWRHADLIAFGFMSNLAQGQSAWLQPQLGGIATPDGALLPYWIGALFIKILPFLEPALAARLPFIGILAVVMGLVWYACFHLARTDAAQPISFAFGGEAATVDYARTLADGAVLALVASLGLASLAHETTPELVQLLAVSLWLYALACAPFRKSKAQWGAAGALVLLALSGAAQFGLVLGLGGLLVCHFSSFVGARQLRIGLGVGLALTLVLAHALNLWQWRVVAPEPGSLLRLLAWFTWPTAALAAWTLWRWRAYLGNRHVSIPLTLVLLAVISCMSMGGYDRALLLALPGLAVMASFALPTLNRSLSAMVDWFSVFAFSVLAVFVWLYYLAIQTTWLPRLTANVLKLSPDFSAPFDPIDLALGIAGTMAWVLLVRWRTSRQRRALWRSLVLPAGGTVLIWLLLMTLWLPPINHAFSHQQLLATLKTVLPDPHTGCIAAPGQNLSLVATLEAQGGWRVRADSPLIDTPCQWALRVVSLRQTDEAVPSGWILKATLRRQPERNRRYQVLQRGP